MKKAKIIFEVTETKTNIVVVGITGNTIERDITGTNIEKQLVNLLKKIQKLELSNKVENTLDLNSWKEIPQQNPESQLPDYRIECEE